MARVAIVGAGMMGSAMTVPLRDRGHEVRLVGTHLDEEIVEKVRATGVHPKLGLALDPGVAAYRHVELDAAVADVDAIVLGVSSAGIRWATERVAPHARAGRPIVMITKGLDWDGERLRPLPEVVRTGLPDGARADTFPAAIGGPCIAGEDRATLEALRELLATPYYHLFPSTDVVGVEVCAALKNAFAMGIAIATGMHERAGGQPGSIAMHNLESAIFAQAVVETARVVRALGGDPVAAAGLAGAGDLDVTTNGGRTGRFGRLLGLGLPRAEAVARMEGATLECLEILAVMREATRGLAAAGRLRPGGLPLLDHLAAVALDDAPVDFPLSRFFEASA